MKFQRGYCKMATSRKTSGNWEISVSSPTHLEVQLQLQTIEKYLLRNLWSCPSTKWWPASNSASQHDLIYIAGRSHPYGYKPQTVSSTCQVYYLNRFTVIIILKFLSGLLSGQIHSNTHSPLSWKFFSFKSPAWAFWIVRSFASCLRKFGHQTQTIFLPPWKQKTSPYLLPHVYTIS